MSQTVPESALKPYTRYYLSVFVLQADSLHIIASRYGNEVSQVVNVGILHPCLLPLTMCSIIQTSSNIQLM
ncbi:hypothetical protein [Bacillus thuringiensis]|uniref:hypothetical protein n=1 Tax=Bacillus thuringiensis TaxID=1428 RepID=UPI003BF98CE2